MSNNISENSHVFPIVQTNFMKSIEFLELIHIYKLTNDSFEYSIGGWR